MTSRWKKFRNAFKAQKLLDNAADGTPTTTDLVSIQLGNAKLSLEPITKKWRIVSGDVPESFLDTNAHQTAAEEPRLSSLQKSLTGRDTPKKSNAFANVVQSAQTASTKELKQRVQDLEEENNMLRYRQEILLDMLSVKELDRTNYEIIFQKLGIRPERLKKRKD